MARSTGDCTTQLCGAHRGRHCTWQSPSLFKTCSFITVQPWGNNLLCKHKWLIHPMLLVPCVRFNYDRQLPGGTLNHHHIILISPRSYSLSKLMTRNQPHTQADWVCDLKPGDSCSPFFAAKTSTKANPCPSGGPGRIFVVLALRFSSFFESPHLKTSTVPHSWREYFKPPQN